ncbi:MAG: OmpA family protein [Myxococcales bacterium]|nr:OmpA family protein [Myxococcales bacterium]MCB9708969.1 OmpA family protein [Myxococcales bacterium]
MKHVSFGLVVLGVSGLLTAGCSSDPQVFRGTTPVTIEGQTPQASAPPPRVEVKDNRIVIHEKIQFEFDKAVIKEESFDLLREIAETIAKNPHIKKIRIEGHASSEGSDEYNLKLSQARAQAVLNHLVDKGGIAAERLVAQGFGEEQPIADNATDAGREANRRVEFIITRQEVTTTKVAVDPKTGKQKVLAKDTKDVSNSELKTPPAPQTEPAEDKETKSPEKKQAETAMPKKENADPAENPEPETQKGEE